MKKIEGLTKEQVVQIINKALSGLCEKFRFGYFDKDEMFQEGWLFAMKALEKYDPKKAVLENFLRVHIRNRFINLKRNKFSRKEPPCVSCPFYDPECLKSDNKCAEFMNKDDCDKWAAWRKRNTSKAGLMRPIDIDSVTEDEGPTDNFFLNKMNLAELKRKIDDAMPVELRGDYLRMMDGVYVSKQKKDKIKEFLRELGIFDETEDG